MSRRWRAPLVAALCATALGSAACAPNDGTSSGGADGDNQRYISGTGKVETVPVDEREAAPNLSGKTLEGDRLATKSYRGDVVVVNFWASWCSPCRSEAPALQAVYSRAKSDGVRFVGINFKDNRANAAVFAREFKLTYPSIYDQPGETALAFRGDLPPAAVPSTIIIDRNGKVAARVIGETTFTRLSKVVQQVSDE